MRTITNLLFTLLLLCATTNATAIKNVNISGHKQIDCFDKNVILIPTVTTDFSFIIQVEYGTSSAYLDQDINYGGENGTLPQNTSISPEITLSGLNPNTTYYYRYVIKDADGFPVKSSEQFSFTTKEKPVITFTTNRTIGDKMGLYVGSCIKYDVFYIDYGDGNLKKRKTSDAYSSPYCEDKIKSQTIKIYGDNVACLNIYNKEITSVDVTNCPKLYSLIIRVNKITELDLTNNPFLEYFDLTRNKLSSLDLSKNLNLRTLKCPGNDLTELKIGSDKITRLDCGGNKLTSLDVSNKQNIITLSCGGNKLTNLNVTNCTTLTELSCYANELKSLDVSTCTALKKLNIERNYFTFTTLHNPISFDEYKYAPQELVPIPETAKTGEEIDLSSTYLIKDGKTTQYTWRSNYSDLTEDIDYAMENGKFKFLKVPYKTAECKMTHKSYPDLIMWSTHIAISQATGIDSHEDQSQNTKIYSANKNIIIKTQEPGTYQIYNLNGKLIKAGTLNTGNTSCPIYNKGIYLIKTTINNQVKTEKLSVH